MVGSPLMGGGSDRGGPVSWRFHKLDMPLCEGEDLNGWIMRVERYFDFYKLTEEDRMDAVLVALEGDALKWYQCENKRRPINR